MDQKAKAKLGSMIGVGIFALIGLDRCRYSGFFLMN
jgi:hypothetical protein